MEGIGPHIAPQVLAACQAGLSDAGSAFASAFDAPLELAIEETGTLELANLDQEFRGSGLAIALQVGDLAAVLLVSETAGLLPAWYNRPDDTQRTKLLELAQALAKTLWPAEFATTGALAIAIEDLADALRRAECREGAAVVRLSGKSGDNAAPMHLVWPLAQPKNLAEVATTSHPASAYASDTHSRFDELPPYARSLLRIQVPVIVTLASKKQPVGKIIEVVPGAILQFPKSCDERLDLEVAGRPIAKGECIKVGDKFGLRITSLTLPAERFAKVGA